MNADELNNVADKLRMWASRIFDPRFFANDLERQSEEKRLQSTVEKIDTWAAQLAEAEGLTRVSATTQQSQSRGQGVARRWWHSSVKMVDAIRASFCVKGGAQRLASMEQQTINLVASPSLVGTLCRGFAERGDVDDPRDVGE